nr:type II toxin-antitoxin system HigB family toxin [Dyella kyungheensis]
MQIWRKLMEGNQFYSFHDLRRTFGSMDIYEEKYIFDIRGNHYRIVTGISFSQQVCYTKHVLTHAEYNKGKWK